EATDQRGQPRGGGAGQCDVGAFEAQPPPSPPAAPPAPPPVATPIVAAPTPLAPAKRCKKGQKLKKGKCVKRKRKRKRGA
ncbi:MAG: choice-of-anchor Q domain-containing protein, partial [Solirubrobacterales bacterium]